LSIDPDHGGFSVERLGPVSDPPPDEASALQCETSAVDSELSVTVVLRWGEGLPGSLFVTASAHVSDIALEDYVSTPGSPDAASAEAMAAVPEAAPPDQPDVGDPFGGSGNCLSSGYDQMRLPSDSRLVGTEGGPDGRSVLATDDAEAAMAALTESSLGGSGGDLPSPPEDLVLADGTSVRTQGFSISGGGGACELLSSPDGRHVLVTMHSD
ncbi:MAG TPA: hypothetical protein VGO60_03545, partial [Iamia sp.]|nr:hypothetical protein [Iamia sp.]